MPRNLRRILLLTMLILACAISEMHFIPPVAAASIPHPETEHYLFTPLAQNQYKSQQPLDWDARLNERGATFVPAQVTSDQGYWRLVKAVWYDESESQGRHHILIDTLDISGRRQPGVGIIIQWTDGTHTIFSETKPGEPYAANFAMYALAPAYDASPNNGAPSDQVDGMGLGDLRRPNWNIHTSYGLTWRWSIAP